MLDNAPGKDRVAVPRVRRGKRVFSLLIAILSLAAAVFVGVPLGEQWWHVGRFMVTTDDAYIATRAANLSPKVSGYVVEILIPDHASVKSGDLIARIDAGDYKLALGTAQIQLETQRAVVARIGRQVEAQRALVAHAEAQANAANALAARAALDLRRQTELAARKINSAAALDSAEAADLQAKAAVSAASAAIANAVANTTVLVAQQTEAETMIRLAEIGVAKAERDLSFTEIRAPIDGILGNRGMQVGDYVQPTQRLASLVPMHAIFIEANFKETQLARLKVGHVVRVTVDAHAGEQFEGHILSMSPASGAVFSLLPPDNATGNFTKIVQRIAVRIALPPEVIARATLRPGMSVVVAVDTRTPGTPDAPGISVAPPASASPARATSSIR